MKASLHKETGEKMSVYEVGYLLLPNISEEKLGDEVAIIRKLIEKEAGEILAEDFPKLLTLSYTIEKDIEAKKHKTDEAYFGSLKFEMPVANIVTVDKELAKIKNILRYLVVKSIKGNTIFSERVSMKKSEDGQKDSLSTEGAEKKPANQEDIDKSIDALVIG